LRWDIGVLSSLLREILVATLEPRKDLSIPLTHRNVVPVASVGCHEVKEQRPVVLNFLWIAQDDPPRCIAGEVGRKIWVLDEHAPNDRVGFERLSTDEKREHGLDGIACFPANLHARAKPFQLGFSPQDRVADRHRLRFGANEINDLSPTVSGQQCFGDVGRGVGVRPVAPEEVVGHPRLDEAKLRLGLSADEVLEIFIREADRSVCLPHTWSEIGAEITDVSLVETGHCRKIRYGDGPWQCDEACTEGSDILIGSHLISGVFELLPEDLLEILAVWAKMIKRACRFGSGII
jgi:hypothetical protein